MIESEPELLMGNQLAEAYLDLKPEELTEFNSLQRGLRREAAQQRSRELVTEYPSADARHRKAVGRYHLGLLHQAANFKPGHSIAGRREKARLFRVAFAETATTPRFTPEKDGAYVKRAAKKNPDRPWLELGDYLSWRELTFELPQLGPEVLKTMLKLPDNQERQLVPEDIFMGPCFTNQGGLLKNLARDLTGADPTKMGVYYAQRPLTYDYWTDSLHLSSPFGLLTDEANPTLDGLRCCDIRLGYEEAAKKASWRRLYPSELTVCFAQVWGEDRPREEGPLMNVLYEPRSERHQFEEYDGGARIAVPNGTLSLVYYGERTVSDRRKYPFLLRNLKAAQAEEARIKTEPVNQLAKSSFHYQHRFRNNG